MANKKWDIEKVRLYVEKNSNCRLLSAEYINTKSKLKFLCSCGNKFEVSLTTFIHQNKRQCNLCGNSRKSQYKKHTLNYVKEFIETNSDSILLSTEYINSKEKLELQCQCGEMFEVTFSDFRTKNKRCCNKCSNLERYNTGTFKEKLSFIYGDEYTVIGEYINSGTPILIRHNDCGYEWNIAPRDILRRNSCPHCNRSNGERYIKKLLDINLLNYIQQYSFNDCRNQKPLPFDFAVFNGSNNLFLLIEYDGIHHFEPTKFGGMSEECAIERFEAIKINDDIKNKYCQQNNIKLIRIPYWDFSNLDKILKQELVEVINIEK